MYMVEEIKQKLNLCLSQITNNIATGKENSINITQPDSKFKSGGKSEI